MLAPVVAWGDVELMGVEMARERKRRSAAASWKFIGVWCIWNMCSARRWLKRATLGARCILHSRVEPGRHYAHLIDALPSSETLRFQFVELEREVPHARRILLVHGPF